MSQVLDPMAAAVEEAERPNFLYGQLETSAEFVMFSGGKKVSWNEQIDEAKDRLTEVTFLINPIEESGLTNLSTRSMICNNYNEWAKIVWPSLRDECGIANLREAHGKYVKAEIVKTGRSYVSKKTGDKIENTTFKFVAVFDSKDDCAADYLGEGITNKAQALASDSGHTGVAEMAAEVDMSPTVERETAAAFLPALVKMSAGNRDMLTQQIQSMPLVAKFFTIDSPEVQQLLVA